MSPKHRLGPVTSQRRLGFRVTISSSQAAHGLEGRNASANRCVRCTTPCIAGCCSSVFPRIHLVRACHQSGDDTRHTLGLGCSTSTPIHHIYPPLERSSHSLPPYKKQQVCAPIFRRKGRMFASVADALARRISGGVCGNTFRRISGGVCGNTFRRIAGGVCGSFESSNGSICGSTGAGFDCSSGGVCRSTGTGFDCSSGGVCGIHRRSDSGSVCRISSGSVLAGRSHVGPALPVGSDDRILIDLPLSQWLRTGTTTSMTDDD